MNAATRPTVGLPAASDSIDEVEEDSIATVNAFYQPAMSPIVKPNTSGIVNGDVGKKPSQPSTPVKAADSKTEKGGFAAGLRNMFRKKQDSTETAVTSPKTTAAPAVFDEPKVQLRQEPKQEPRHEPKPEPRHEPKPEPRPEQKTEPKPAPRQRSPEGELDVKTDAADTAAEPPPSSMKRGMAPPRALLPPVGRGAIPAVSADVLAEFRNKRLTTMKPANEDDSASTDSQHATAAAPSSGANGRLGSLGSGKNKPPPPKAPKLGPKPLPKRPGSVSNDQATPAGDAASNPEVDKVKADEVAAAVKKETEDATVLDKNSNITPQATETSSSEKRSSTSSSELTSTKSDSDDHLDAAADGNAKSEPTTAATDNADQPVGSTAPLAAGDDTAF